jgi:mTERF
MDLERDIVPAEEKLINEYGFLKQEVNFVIRYNPKFIVLDSKESGINVLKSFFVDKKGFQFDSVRTLVVRYPYVLSKTEEEFNRFFEIMKAQGISDEEAMRCLLEIPKLISRKDLEKNIKEI